MNIFIFCVYLFVRMMSKDELKTLVIQSTVPLSTDSPRELEEVSTKLEEYLGRFDTLDGRLYLLSNIHFHMLISKKWSYDMVLSVRPLAILVHFITFINSVTIQDIFMKVYRNLYLGQNDV